jgi:hypothetical protein
METWQTPRLLRPPPAHVVEDPIIARVRDLLSSSLGEWLDPDKLLAMAEDLRSVERLRVHHAGLVAVALVLSSMQHGADTQGRWLDAQAIYERLGGTPSGATSFRNAARKTRRMLATLLQRRYAHLAKDNPALRGRLRRFADVLIPDGCAFKIAAALAHQYPGTGTAAEFKLHAVHSLRAGGVRDLSVSAGSVHDNDGFWPTWVKGALYLWDLGFNDYGRFIQAHRAGSFVLQRLKDGANPLLLKSWVSPNAGVSVLSEKGRPMRLNHALAQGEGAGQATLDLDVLLTDSEAGDLIARVVCVPYNGQDRYYLTNLPRDVFGAVEIAEMYRIRWEIELFFRDLKGALRLDEVRRMKNPESLLVMVLASLLAATLGQELLPALNDLPESEPTPQSPSTPAQPGFSPLRSRPADRAVGTARPRQTG